MKSIKIRTPVICQNGHKSYWYWEVDKNDIMEGRRIKIEPECNCPKAGMGEGWQKNGDDELFIGKQDKNKKDIYENDILLLKSKENNKKQFLEIIKWENTWIEDGYGNNNDYCGFTLPANLDDFEYTIIGNKYLNQELLNKNIRNY